MARKKGVSRRGFSWARNCLVCGVLAFVGLQLAMNLALERWHPEEYDPEYVERRDLLQARRAENPGRAVALVMGSSRIVMGFAPERLERSTRADGPLVVNFSRFGQGPLHHAIFLERLERDGLLPQFVVLEVIPAYLYRESPQLLIGILASADLAQARRYLPLHKLAQHFLLRRLEIGARYAQRLLGLRGGPLLGANNLYPLGGYRHIKDKVSDSFRQEKLAVTHRYYFKPMSEFAVAAEEDRALRDCLEFCQVRGIKTSLLLSPEGSTLRSWYAPHAEPMLKDYFAGLRRDHDFELIDARTWLSDEEFYDDHHPLRAGAEALTQRLERELLAPLLDQERVAAQ